MQTNLKLILAFFLYHGICAAQQTGHTTVTLIDSSRSNRQIPVEIYYPSPTQGNDTPISPGTFPLITFGHGFVMTWSAYGNFQDVLVPEGYIVAFPTTEGGLAPDHENFGKDLRFVTGQLQQQGAGLIIPASSLASTSAIMGHSMGGGCSFLAAENNTTITTMVSFAAANTNPSAFTASQHLSVPTLIFSGTGDCVAPPAQHQDILYDSTSSPFKTQVYINGGGHCYFANYNFNCAFGEATCSPNLPITRTEQQAAVNDLLLPWLGYYLKGDCAKANEFQDSLSLSQRITFRQSQSIACVTALPTEKNSSAGISLFPNPADQLINISNIPKHVQQLSIHDLTGRVLINHDLITSGETILDVSGIASGIYMVHFSNDVWIKMVKN